MEATVPVAFLGHTVGVDISRYMTGVVSALRESIYMTGAVSAERRRSKALADPKSDPHVGAVEMRMLVLRNKTPDK